MIELTHISLFTGIGGIDLAAEWAGFETILMVENNAYCQKVLNKHWPDVPIIGDIKDVTKETIADADTARLSDRSEEYRRKQTQGRKGFSGTSGQDSISADRRASSIPSVTLITGGFPCQPVSQAGKRRGKEDDRWLWPEMLRVISEVRPTWVVAENVAGLASMVEWDSVLEVDIKEYTKEEMAAFMLDMGEVRERTGRGSLDEILESLEAEGYKVRPFRIPACAVNAPHRRDRIFIVAWNTNGRNGNKGAKQEMGEGQDSQSPRVHTDVAHSIGRGEQQSERVIGEVRGRAGNGSEDVADTTGKGLQNRGRSQVGEPGREEPEPERPSSQSREIQDDTGIPTGERWWAVEPDVGRVAHGIPSRVDRLKGLGNAVVPQQIYPILKAIADIEKGQA